MDWNNGCELTPEYVYPPPQSSSALLFHYSLDQFPETKETTRPAVEAQPASMVGGVDQKKKRFSHDQLESLERSFQEEAKLDPDRKTKLAKELSLQPRQVAVWFQNRRARCKAKQLEHLYDTLKQQFDTIAMEKHSLQQEVMKLRSMLREQATRNQGSMAYTTVSEEEAAESTSEGVPSCNDHLFNVSQVSASLTPPFAWCAESADLPSYPF